MATKVINREMVGTIDMKFGDEVYKDTPIALFTTESSYKGETKQSQFFGNGPIPGHDDIAAGQIRIYPTFMGKGANGHKWTNEDILTLFAKGHVHVNGLKRKSDGSEYDVEAVFDPTTEMEFMTKNPNHLMGNVNPDFSYGE